MAASQAAYGGPIPLTRFRLYEEFYFNISAFLGCGLRQHHNLHRAKAAYFQPGCSRATLSRRAETNTLDDIQDV